jgi:hypothetical protein
MLITSYRQTNIFIFFWCYGPNRVMAWSFTRRLDHTANEATQSVGRLEQVMSSSQKPLPDKTRHSQPTDIRAPARFKPTIPAGERPQT